MSEDNGGGEVERVGTGAKTVLAFGLTWAGAKAGGGDPAVALAAATGAGALPYAETWWATLRQEWRRDQEDNIRALNIVAATEAGWTDEELGERAGRSQESRMLYRMAAEAAAKTAWPDKVVAIGQMLAQGLIADGDAVDVPQYVLAAMAEMERPHVSLLDLLVRYEPQRIEEWRAVPHRIPSYRARGPEEVWFTGRRTWRTELIPLVRPELAPVLTGLAGTLVRHGLAQQADRTREAIEQLSKDFQSQFNQQRAQANRGQRPPPGVQHPPRIRDIERSWSPTELGEQVLSFYLDAAGEKPDAGPESASSVTGR